MPSLLPRWLSFPNKKKGHHGSKFPEYECYENQRFPPYHNITQNLQHPPYHHHHHHQLPQNHILQQTPYHNQYQQATSHPFAFSPRQHHHSQFPQQNTIVQSPQLITSPTVTNSLNQCHCQQCTASQLAYAHHNQNNLGPVIGSPQAVMSPPVASPQVPVVNLQVPSQPQMTLPVQSMVPPNQAPQHPQQQQSVPFTHEHQMVPQQCLQASHHDHAQHHPQPPHQSQHPYHQQNPHQSQHPQHLHHQQQHPQYPQNQQFSQEQQQIGLQVNDIAHQYANQAPNYTVQQGTVLCTCHSCPSHQPLREIGPATQQYHQSQVPAQTIEPAQQQLTQHVISSTHINQHIDMNHNNNVCQHQVIGAQSPHNQTNQQSCGTIYSNTSEGKMCPSQDQNQGALISMSSSTPRIQHQELNNQQQQVQRQQQYSNTDAMNIKQFHYHTIQPTQYQEQKQQMTQEQHHQRIQSLHHQVSRSPNQIHEKPIANVIESATRSYPQVDSRVNEFSRYANVRSIMSESSHSYKYQEHVYCNQKLEPILPHYESPPSYDTFIANKDSFIIGLKNRHTTHHSESLVSQKTKDSSYENLPRFSPYFDGNKQGPGLTT